MSFVNEVAFNELVNDLKVDEDLVVDGTATIENLTVKNLTVTGTNTGLGTDATFTIGEGDAVTEISLSEKIETIDDQISSLQTSTTSNTTQIGLRALKTTVATKAEKTNPEILFSNSNTTLVTFKNTDDQSTVTLNALLDDKANMTDTVIINNHDFDGLITIKKSAADGTNIPAQQTTLKTLLDAKADDGEITTLQTNINAKLDHTDPIIHHTGATYLSFLKDGTAVTLNSLLDAKADDGEITTLQTNINGKLDHTDPIINHTGPTYLSFLKDGTVVTLNYLLDAKADDGEITTLQTNINGKLDHTDPIINHTGATYLSFLKDGTVVTLNSLLDAKADDGEITTLQTNINGKLDHTDPIINHTGATYLSFLKDGTAVTLNSLLDAKVDAGDLSGYALTTDLDSYATTATVSTLETSIQSLASTTYVNNNFAKKTNPLFVIGADTEKSLTAIIAENVPDPVDLSAYATKTDPEFFVDGSATARSLQNIITDLGDLEYATKTDPTFFLDGSDTAKTLATIIGENVPPTTDFALVADPQFNIGETGEKSLTTIIAEYAPEQDLSAYSTILNPEFNIGGTGNKSLTQIIQENSSSDLTAYATKYDPRFTIPQPNPSIPEVEQTLTDIIDAQIPDLSIYATSAAVESFIINPVFPHTNTLFNFQTWPQMN